MKKVMLMVSLGILALGLAGCANSKNSKVSDQTIKFGRVAQSSQRHLWFWVATDDQHNFAKDSDIVSVLVTENGKAKAYNVNSQKPDIYPKGLNHLTMKDTTKMSDSEIIKKAKENDEKWFKYDQEQDLKSLQKKLKDDQNVVKNYTFDDPMASDQEYKFYQNSIPHDQKSIERNKAAKYESLPSRKISILASTDSTGNNVATEIVTVAKLFFHATDKSFEAPYKIPDGTPMYSNYYYSNQEKGYYGFYRPLKKAQQIYSDYYAGYTAYTGRDDTYAALVTKADKNAKVKMDSKDTKGIHVKD